MKKPMLAKIANVATPPQNAKFRGLDFFAIFEFFDIRSPPVSFKDNRLYLDIGKDRRRLKLKHAKVAGARLKCLSQLDEGPDHDS